jgi:hydroxylamine reductase
MMRRTMHRFNSTTVAALAATPVFQVLTAAQPNKAALWSKELTLLHKHHVHTAGCWAALTANAKAGVVADGLPEDAAAALDAAVGAAGAAQNGGAASKLLVLYASQTGTAEALSKMVGMLALTHKYTPVVCSMDQGVEHLLTAAVPPKAVVFVCSTGGVGEVPPNGRAFMRELAPNTALGAALKDMPYAIMGLGNSHNDNFCASAKKLYGGLKACKAASLLPVKLSCELAAAGHDGAFREWKQGLWKALGATAGDAAVAALYDVNRVVGARAEPHIVPKGFQLVKVRSNLLLSAPQYVPHSKLLTLTIGRDQQLDMLGGEFLRANGRLARLGDLVELLPRNADADVARVGAALGLTLEAVIDVAPLTGAPPSCIDGAKLSVATLLRETLDLSAVPSRSLLEAFAVAATDKAEADALTDLANDLRADSAFAKRLAAGAWSVADTLCEFKSVGLSLSQLLTHMPRLQPRVYTIASAMVRGKLDEFEVCYSVPHRETANGMPARDGVCTGMLDGMRAGAQVYARLVPGNLRAPPAAAPVGYVALGSGVASVRAMLQARLAAKAAGAAVAPALVYYGFREAGKDQLFTEEFTAMEDAGVAKFVFVPSHAVKGKLTTPMDVMPTDAANNNIAALLADGGHAVYCGLGGSVPTLVEAAFRQCGVDVSLLRSAGRYHEEYFSPDADTENLLRARGGAEFGSKTLAGRMGQTDMFCMQCEQTFQGKGCRTVGVCGKTARVAALQDVAVHATKVLAFYAHRLRALGAAEDAAANRLTFAALFATLTNVNNDEARFTALLAQLHAATARLEQAYKAKAGAAAEHPTVAVLPKTLPPADGLIQMGKTIGVLSRFTDPATQSAAGVTEMLLYAMKGIAAYGDHSLMNGLEDVKIYAFLHEALDFLVGPDAFDLGKGLALCLRAGEINVATMGLLDTSNNKLGVPSPRSVPVSPVRAGKCILVSGHDLVILKALLEKTEPLGIDVYTHGEMLPAHAYPELNKYKTLVGHFGGAWHRQGVEFPHFPGPVLMTTNCLTEPDQAYKARLFTAGQVGWPGVPHVGDSVAELQLDGVLAAAQQAAGFAAGAKAFTYADPKGCPRAANLTVGFGHATVLGAAPTILEEIKKGNITRFFLVGGCDGFEGDRSYFTDLVASAPPTAVILTLGCGKFRFNHMDLGTIGDTGLPRILDMGQCNDTFSAVQVAVGLAGALNCGVGELPLTIALSWFEQKAVAVLLSCLHLGLKPIHLGPSLPAFITPEVLDVLVKDFGIVGCGNAADDMKKMVAAPGMS